METLLSSLSATCSIRGPKIAPKFAAAIFTHVYRLLSAVLMVHRVKIRGRLHLVLQLLQAMLRLLFVPDPQAQGHQAIPTRLAPPWLVGEGLCLGLGVSEAAVYSRLLTTLCDPSVSSVARANHHAKQQLTPATDKARRLVGRHLPYLLMDYARCQLHSRLLHEVKDALMPGFYAVIEATDQGTLRMLNASVDSSSRAIFKTLMDDYRRLGRWDRT